MTDLNQIIVDLDPGSFDPEMTKKYGGVFLCNAFASMLLFAQLTRSGRPVTAPQMALMLWTQGRELTNVTTMFEVDPDAATNEAFALLKKFHSMLREISPQCSDVGKDVVKGLGRELRRKSLPGDIRISLADFITHVRNEKPD